MDTPNSGNQYSALKTTVINGSYLLHDACKRSLARKESGHARIACGYQKKVSPAHHTGHVTGLE